MYEIYKIFIDDKDKFKNYVKSLKSNGFNILRQEDIDYYENIDNVFLPSGVLFIPERKEILIEEDKEIYNSFNETFMNFSIYELKNTSELKKILDDFAKLNINFVISDEGR